MITHFHDFRVILHVPRGESASHPLSLCKRECPKLATHPWWYALLNSFMLEIKDPGFTDSQSP